MNTEHSERFGVVAEHGQFILRRATLPDAIIIGTDLRASDLLDLQAATRESAVAVIERPIRAGRHVLAIDHLGKCIAVGGVTDIEGEDRGAIWMLGTPALDAALAGAARRLPARWLDQIMAGRRKVFNIIPVSNEMTLRWLTWLGFRPVRTHANFRGLGHDCVEMELERPQGGLLGRPAASAVTPPAQPSSS